MNKESLYKRHKIIYNDPVSGKFNKIRLTSMSFMTLTFFILPWISYNGKQAFLFDISCTRFYFFGSIFWPQDFILLALISIIAILSLFLITVYAGRIWCGFLCPQSIWIKIAVFFSRKVEGNRNKRKKIDNEKLNINIFKIKIIKHILWISFSFLTALTFVGYFVPTTFLYNSIIEFKIKYWCFFWIFFFTILTYFNIGWFREQFCFIVCPYSRLQSVMFDENTWIVAYDKNRGEKRGTRSKNDNYQKMNLGDCVDCYKCVNCCPTGIDIRDGLQMECIGCAACIDACNNVMKIMKYDTGLIRYMKESSLNNKLINKTSIFRLIAYVSILFLFISIFYYVSNNRSLVQVNINRSQNQLYNINKNGDIENYYILKITNKTIKKNIYKISILNNKFKYIGVTELSLNGQESALLDVKLILENTNGSLKFTDVSFKIECLNINKNNSTIKNSKFIKPT
ncbi:MAG TPA: cytochrome c oxidase accessory protein CcoG [Candidatus Azoamicus sp. MARI]